MSRFYGSLCMLEFAICTITFEQIYDMIWYDSLPQWKWQVT